MIELGKFLIFPAFLAGVGWMLSKAFSHTARQIARAAIGSLGVILAALAITGWGGEVESFAGIHRWSGHGLVIATWLAIPFTSGVILQRQVRTRPIAAVAQLIALAGLSGLTFLASVSGYLGPSYGDPTAYGEETRNRFTVLHLFAIPMFMAALVAQSWWFLRPSRGGAVNDDDAAIQPRSGAERVDTGNPCESPPT